MYCATYAMRVGHQHYRFPTLHNSPCSISSFLLHFVLFKVSWGTISKGGRVYVGVWVDQSPGVL